MHILLTDILTCPRCGPAFGLILLAEQTAGRRVLQGVLGCANCRERYPVRDGAIFFAGAPRNAGGTADAGGAGAAGAAADAADAAGASDASDAADAADAAGASDADPAGRGAAGDRDRALQDEQAVRLAALMGVTGGRGYVLLTGPAAAHARALAALLEGVEVVTAVLAGPEPAAPPARLAEAGVSPMTVAARLPLASGRVAGVVLSGAAADTLLEEGARVTAPLGRLVLDGAPADAAERLRAAGLRVLLHEADTVLAGRHQR
jgi:uncharacterized protein YbaR (Trm112 family)